MPYMQLTTSHAHRDGPPLRSVPEGTGGVAVPTVPGETLLLLKSVMPPEPTVPGVTQTGIAGQPKGYSLGQSMALQSASVLHTEPLRGRVANQMKKTTIVRVSKPIASAICFCFILEMRGQSNSRLFGVNFTGLAGYRQGAGFFLPYANLRAVEQRPLRLPLMVQGPW